MRDSRMGRGEEAPTPTKSKKKKMMTQVAPALQIKTETKVVGTTPHSSAKSSRGSKKAAKKTDAATPFQQFDGSAPEATQDLSGSSDEYRVLRHKYLMLEEEYFSLGKQLSEAEAEVETLEDEKHSLLDQLVVLEGLMDPSELRPKEAP